MVPHPRHTVRTQIHYCGV